jgi:hypothetical protein
MNGYFFLHATVVMEHTIYSLKLITAVKGTVLQTVRKCCVMRSKRT